jgi:invasion protein IalB
MTLAVATAEEPSSEKSPAETDAAPPIASEKVGPKAASQDSGPLIAVGAALAFLILVASLIVASKTPSSGSTTDSSPAPAVPASEPATAQNASSHNSSASPGDWQLSSDTNAVTGEVTTVASLHSALDENQYIIVRLIGKKLDCYVNTNEFLETVENIESHLSTVQYKFDDGKVVRQGWTLSSNNEALFYPGNCATFIARIKKAKTLALEFRPSEKIPETITFDVEGFPEAFRGGI